jgi:hypothetical protein
VLCLFTSQAETGERAVLTKEELQAGLSQFTQVDGWYRHSLNQFVFTDGVKWLCDNGNCHWLLLDIAFYQFRIKMQHQQLESFQIWQVRRVSDNSWVLECKTSKNSQPLIQKDLEAVNFALDELTLWLVNGTLLLPNEYLKKTA